MKKLLAASMLALSTAAHAELVGVVVGVPDGDTLAVKIDERVLTVNVGNIDAPEVGQPFGAEARDSLAGLCEAKTVELDELGVDRARHVFGDVECAGVDAGREQVKRGLAWAAPGASDSGLRELQAQARAEHKGLWSDAAPVPPWQWSAIFTQ